MKRLSFRFVRRAFLILALLFPVMYMFGSFVAGLAGSHGNALFAQDEEVVVKSYVVPFQQLLSISDDSTRTNYGVTCVSNGDGSFTLNGTSTGQSGFGLGPGIGLDVGHTYLCRGLTGSGSTNTFYLTDAYTFSFASTDVFGTIFTRTSSRLFQPYIFFTSDVTFTNYIVAPMLFDLTSFFGDDIPTATEFYSQFSDSYYPKSSPVDIVVEFTGVPSYSQFVFNQILGSDNIIKQWGYYALSDVDKGFEPFSVLIQSMDDNFLHFGTSNDLALFMYGYCYFALNVIAIYELVVLVVMVFTFPLKLTDRFTKEM